MLVGSDQTQHLTRMSDRSFSTSCDERGGDCVDQGKATAFKVALSSLTGELFTASVQGPIVSHYNDMTGRQITAAEFTIAV